MKAVNYFMKLTLLGVLTGCATSGKSTLVGSGVGAGVGAGIGAMVDPGPKGEGRIRNVFIGAAAGSLVGGVAGYLAHESIEKREKDALEKGKAEGKKEQSESFVEGEQPVLIPAKVEPRFVDDQVRGNVFIPKHMEYRIVEPARWSK